MNTVSFYSQAGQDEWVFKMFKLWPDPTGKGATTIYSGTFLDIGCNEPIHWSNTYALEQLGWRGVLVDNSHECCEKCRGERQSVVAEVDATVVDWKQLLMGAGFWPKIDYLSLDCDEATVAIARRLPLNELRFRLMTVEHDAYRFGDGPRQEMRQLFTAAGYELAFADVAATPEYPFEDWWIHPQY